MPNYSFVIDSSFKPYTMQEMLVPFMMYKEAFEKSEDAYRELTKGAETLDYLAGEIDPEDEKAANIYNNYANELKTQAEDLAKNGLSLRNRSALTSLKRRYNGEIGRLVEADTKLKKEEELRRTLEAKDPSMLWAENKLHLSDYLDNKKPNLYGISGNDLYTKAAVASSALSKRMFTINGETKTLGGFYRDFITRRGYSPEQLNKFGAQISADFANEMSAIPEMKLAADQILESYGVNANLKGANLNRARTHVIRGLIDGAVYEESHSPQRDLGVPTWAEARADQWRQAEFGLRMQQAADNRAYKAGQLELLKEKIKGKNGTGGTGGSGYGTVLNQGVRLQWKGDNPNSLNGDADEDMADPELIPNDVKSYVGQSVSYEKLPQYMKDKVLSIIGEKGDKRDYLYYYRPYKSGGLWNDQEAALDIVPRKIQKGTGDSDDLSSLFSMMGTTLPVTTNWGYSQDSDNDE